MQDRITEIVPADRGLMSKWVGQTGTQSPLQWTGTGPGSPPSPWRRENNSCVIDTLSKQRSQSIIRHQQSYWNKAASQSQMGHTNHLLCVKIFFAHVQDTTFGSTYLNNERSNLYSDDIVEMSLGICQLTTCSDWVIWTDKCLGLGQRFADVVRIWYCHKYLDPHVWIQNWLTSLLKTAPPPPFVWVPTPWRTVKPLSAHNSNQS